MADAYRSSLMVLPSARCVKRCKFCAYHADNGSISPEVPGLETLAEATERFFEEHGDAISRNGEIYIVNSGSILEERQTPREYLTWLGGFLAGKDLRLVLECRADSDVDSYLSEIEFLLGRTEGLTFGIGVEAYRPDLPDDNLLFRRLGKGITEEQCLSQAGKLHGLGCQVKGYAIIAPPWLGGPSYLEEGYRASMDWLIETAFMTADFIFNGMEAEILGLSPFFPYKATNAPVPEDWAPISATEAAEVAHQVKQLFPEKRVDFTSRSIHFPHGNFFKGKGLPTPIDPASWEAVSAARENVADIAEAVFGRRGETSLTGRPKGRKD